jgi:GTP pyrophosphokinase
LTDLGATADVILAGMFCDVGKKGVVSLDDLKSDLPREVYDIIVKVQSIGSELALATDEVLLIKLAERLHNMRTIEFIDESKKQQKAKETIELFMPLARRLDNKKLIDELNDLSMKCCN